MEWQRVLLVLLLSVTSARSEDAPSAKTASRIVLQRVLTAGLRHHDAKLIWDTLSVGESVKLIRESDNPFDGNAVRVGLGDKTLGYLPRAENVFVARQLDRGNRLSARIAALSISKNHRLKLEIEIFAPMP